MIGMKYQSYHQLIIISEMQEMRRMPMNCIDYQK